MIDPVTKYALIVLAVMVLSAILPKETPEIATKKTVVTEQGLRPVPLASPQHLAVQKAWGLRARS